MIGNKGAILMEIVLLAMDEAESEDPPQHARCASYCSRGQAPPDLEDDLVKVVMAMPASGSRGFPIDLEDGAMEVLMHRIKEELVLHDETNVIGGRATVQLRHLPRKEASGSGGQVEATHCGSWRRHVTRLISRR